MKTSSYLSLSFVALTLPLLAWAAPGNVTGINATVQADGVHVTWNKVDGDVATYKVYYSHASILNNAGLFDDFEEAAGTETSHVLQNIPASSDLYVAVLASDSQGADSPFFTEEAHVVLNANAAGTSSSATATMSAPTMPTASSVAAGTVSSTSMTQQPSEDVLRLLSVDVVSATGVVLHFSHQITIDPSHATDALTIETASGTKLALKRFMVQGKDVQVDTETQTRGLPYKVTIGTAVSAVGSAGQRLAISPDQAPVLFSGHPNGKDPETSDTPSTVRTEVVQLRLRAQPTGTSYRTETTWQPAGGDVKGYAVSQTTDGGRTFTEARNVTLDGRDIIVSSVPAGTFGMKVQTIYTDGTMSKGIVQTIDLPALGTSNGGGVTGSVIKTPTKGSTDLPNSGPGLWVAIAGAVSAATWMQMKRKDLKRVVA